MAKKNNQVQVVESGAELKALMEQHENVSLAKLANAVELSYAIIRTKAKQPIDGAVYDATAVNYDAIMTYIKSKLPELQLSDLDWQAMNTKSERELRCAKLDTIDFTVGTTYYLRYFKANYTIVYATETHVCIIIADGSNTQPKVMAKNTFVNCGVKAAVVEANEGQL